MPYDARRPYNDLPLLPPPTDLETKAVLKKCVLARTAAGVLAREGAAALRALGAYARHRLGER